MSDAMTNIGSKFANLMDEKEESQPKKQETKP